MTHAPNHLVLKNFGWGKYSTGKHALCWVCSQNFIIFGAREQFCPPTSKFWPSGTVIGLYTTNFSPARMDSPEEFGLRNYPCHTSCD